MKSYCRYLPVLILLGVLGCHDISDQTGFLSSNIYLQGTDTLKVPLGVKGATNNAFLDGSTKPLEFSIHEVTDQNGNHSEQFFEKYSTLSWSSPYDHDSDTTLALVEAKLQQEDKYPISINKVNGAIQYLETTSNLEAPGDLYSVDVKAANSAGEKILKNYVTLELSSESKPFVFYRGTTAILLVNDQGETTFTLYDSINETDLDRRQNIYNRNGKELIDIYKKSDEPSTGVKVLIQYKDAEGKIFDSSEYETYSAGTESYFDYAVGRENTDEGALIQFPVTPWPTNPNLLSYLKGGTKPISTSLDTASLHQEVYREGKYPYLYDWPEPEWGASRWYIRLRSRVVFNENGTWVISATFPYTHLDGSF